MGVLQLLFFRAISLIAFLHNTFLSFVSKAGFYYVAVAQAAPNGQGLAAAGSGSIPSGKGQPSSVLSWNLPPGRGGDMLGALSRFTRKFSLLIKSQIQSISIRELIFQYQDNFLLSCPCLYPSLPPHCTVLHHPTPGQRL